MENAGAVNPALVFSLRCVTERAACAAFNWIGRGDGSDGGRAALDAMRRALAEIDIDAVVVIGEPTRGETPQPQRGEAVSYRRSRPTSPSIRSKARATSCADSLTLLPCLPSPRAAQ